MRTQAVVGVLALCQVACGQIKTKLDAAADLANDAKAKVPDVRQYGRDLEAKIRSLDVRFEMQTVRYDPTTKQFTNLTPPATKRNLFAVERIGDKLYVLGGLDENGDYSNVLERYDPATDAWTILASWPRPGFAFIEKVGELLCAIGGYKNLDQPIRREVDCYDPATDVWSTGAQVPEAYSSFYPVVYGGKAYVLGGSNASLEMVDSSWSYDPITDQWQQLAPLPEPRGLMGAAAVGDRIYLTGGFETLSAGSSGEDEPQDRSMLVYAPAANQWSRAPDMPHSRALYSVDSVNGKLAVFFGVTTGPLVELYDPAKDRWVGGEDPPLLPSGGVYTYVKHAEQMYLFVIADQLSVNKIGSSGALWRYDEVVNQWSEVARRSSNEQDALFVGNSLDDMIYWVGAQTIIVY
jgi:hypothetical protein